MLVVKYSDNVERSVDNIDAPLCGGLYNKEDNSLVTWSGTDPDAKMNFLTWSKEDNGWIVPGNQYNEELNNQQGPMHNGQLLSQTLKDKRRKEET